MTDAQSSSRENPRVLVIGGGATGCGGSDLAMRGFNVTLVSMGINGTTAAFMGCFRRRALCCERYHCAAECMRDGNYCRYSSQCGEVVVACSSGWTMMHRIMLQILCAAASSQHSVEELEPAVIMREEPALTRNVRRLSVRTQP
jgi:hypothetical protein